MLLFHERSTKLPNKNHLERHQTSPTSMEAYLSVLLLTVLLRLPNKPSASSKTSTESAGQATRVTSPQQQGWAVPGCFTSREAAKLHLARFWRSHSWQSRCTGVQPAKVFPVTDVPHEGQHASAS